MTACKCGEDHRPSLSPDETDAENERAHAVAEAFFQHLVARKLRHEDDSVGFLQMALRGLIARDHCDKAHPGKREDMERLQTASMTETEREAWLDGFRFVDGMKGAS